MTQKTNQIAKLNDLLRTTFNPMAGRVVLSQGINALPQKDQFKILGLVQSFNDFSNDNDPYGEHDCATFEYQGRRILWKIDYYNKSYSAGSEHPEDPKQTNRVLTIMIGNE